MLFSEFLPFGVRVGDIISIDPVGNAILPDPIIFYGESYTNFSISKNSVIAFSSIFSQIHNMAIRPRQGSLRMWPRAASPSERDLCSQGGMWNKLHHNHTFLV